MNFFNKLSQRDQILVVVGVIVLIVVLIFFVVLLPQFSKLGLLAEQEEAQAKTLQEAKLNLQRLKSIKSEAAQIEAKLIRLTRRLPQDAEVPSLLVELQDLANSSGLDFASAKLDKVVEKSGFAEIPFTVASSGTFYSLVDYLYRVENMARKVVVNNVTVSTSGKEYPILKIEIKATAYKLSKGSSPTLPPPPSGGQNPPAGAQAPASPAPAP